MKEQTNNILDVALGYIKRGWNPLPVPYRTKIATSDSWQTRVITAETASRYFNGGPQNIGVVLGPTSSGLTDVDLDCREAIILAPAILPKTNAVFGRPSKPDSHHLFVTDLAVTAETAALQFRHPGGTKDMLVELRIGGDKGAQTIFPGSVHESGEPIVWEKDGEPAAVDGKDLQRRVRALAAYCLIARHRPAPGVGAGHDAGRILGGFLARANRTPQQIKHIATAITLTANDPKWKNRVEAAVDAAEAHARGKHAYGLPAMCEMFGDAVASKVAEWLDYPGNSKTELDEQRANLPELVINSSNPVAAAKRLADLIAQSNDFLSNGNWPIQVMAEAGAVPRAIEVSKETVRVLAHTICNPVKIFQTRRGIETEAVSLSNDIALLYLHGLAGSWNLKPFHGITTAPILTNDGGIRFADGYDTTTGLWCHDIPILNIPEQPSGKEAKAALERLRYVFRTFPFADGQRMRDPAIGIDVIDPTLPIGLDESSFMAALLTAVCRQSLELAPGFLCQAPSFSGAGTGKGLLVRAICIIATGARPAAFTSGHNAEEFDKRLTSALVEAHPAVFLDNFNAKELTSDILASALTENPAMVRVLGHSKMVPLHVQTFIGITGNGVEPAEDMARRLLLSQLDAEMENPEERKFAPGFLDRILAARAELLTDALTIWRWGRQNSGALTTGRPLGSFELWCQWIRDPLLSLGMSDPVKRIAEIKANDPKRRALVALFEAWETAHGDQLLKATELAFEVIEHIDGRATRKDGVIQCSRQRVARFLARHAKVRIGGYYLEQESGGRPSRPTAHYRLHKRERT